MQTYDVPAVKACEGIYRAADVARYFQVHRSTVTRIWKGVRHAGVRPAPDFPDIHTRLHTIYLDEEIGVRLRAGMKVKDIAEELDVSESTVYLRRGVFT